jgi:enoyl-CoA hydratase/carnithine racemase
LALGVDRHGRGAAPPEALAGEGDRLPVEAPPGVVGEALASPELDAERTGRRHGGTIAARFRMPFVHLGLVPEGASSVLLPLFVGMHRASEWLLLGDFFDGEAAHRAGLVNWLVEPAQVEALTMEKAEALAARPVEAVRLAKRLIREPLAAAVAGALTREGQLFIERLGSPEALEALMAFASRGRR